jgi:hypothetical protein
MTNEQLAILLMQLRDRLATEINSLEVVLRGTDLDQYWDRRHTGTVGETCRGPLLSLGGSCTNEDHYTREMNGSIVCLDDLKRVVDDLDTQISMLRGEQVDIE